MLAVVASPFLLADCGSHYEAASTEKPPYVCKDPQPIFQAGTDVESGFVRCADGFIHRVAAVACLDPRGVGDCGGGLPLSSCVEDAECADEANGACNRINGSCGCSYGCASDADCRAGEVCACAGVVASTPRCIWAGCALSDDCPGSLCGLSVRAGSCADMDGELACAAADAPCHVDADCSDAPALCDGEPDEATECAIEEGAWRCSVPWRTCDKCW